MGNAKKWLPLYAILMVPLFLLSSCSNAGKAANSAASPVIEEAPEDEGIPIEQTEPEMQMPESTFFEEEPGLPVDDNNLLWIVEPTLEYDEIRFFRGVFGFIGYTTDYELYQIDVKTGEALREVPITGGWRTPYDYGYDPKTGTFYYNLEYDYYPEDGDTVIRESMDYVISVHEVEVFSGGGSGSGFNANPFYKAAIYANGKFVSDFIYDEVISGNKIARVRLNAKYAFADNTGELLTDFLFDEVSANSDSNIAVRKDGYWGFVDPSGNELIPYVFVDALSIDADSAFVKHNGKYGILDVAHTISAFRSGSG